ncbi:MAG: phosphotransferase [Paenibacillaceae bacterium]|nr:phosphotransferase [Paenibacillaceae bacterium]
MIHADLHIGNVVFRDNEPYPIDFGRCGFGYYLYDIAQSIMGLYPSQRTSFIVGYKGNRHMEDDFMPVAGATFQAEPRRDERSRAVVLLLFVRLCQNGYGG